MTYECPRVELMISVPCSDGSGGVVDMPREMDFSITPLHPPDAWEREYEEAVERGEVDADDKKAIESTTRRTFRVDLPRGTPGAPGVAREATQQLNEALAGTGVTVTSYEGQDVPGECGKGVGKVAVKIVFDCVRAVDAAWSSSKLHGWMWGVPGSTSKNPIFATELTPSTPRPRIRKWPPFPPLLPGSPPAPFPLGRPETPHALPGKPGGEGAKFPHYRPDPAPPSLPDLGPWRRMTVGLYVPPFPAGGAPDQNLQLGYSGWQLESFLLPEDGSPAAIADLVALGWRARRCLMQLPQHGYMPLVEIRGDPAGRGRGLAWEVSTRPLQIRAYDRSGMAEWGKAGIGRETTAAKEAAVGQAPGSSKEHRATGPWDVGPAQGLAEEGGDSQTSSEVSGPQRQSADRSGRGGRTTSLGGDERGSPGCRRVPNACLIRSILPTSEEDDGSRETPAAPWETDAGSRTSHARPCSAGLRLRRCVDDDLSLLRPQPQGHTD